jgi:hypothetical protein
MLVIRKEQMEVFEAYTLRNFETEMVKHIQKFAPQQSEIIGEPGVRKVVKLGMERAGQYYFTNRGPICSYLELMVMFGSDFDTDPQYPWLAEILNDTENGTTFQMAREVRLNDKTMKYFDTIYGPGQIYAKDIFQRVTQKRFKDFPTSEDTFALDVIRGLNYINPQKCLYVGEPVLYTLIQRAEEVAVEHAISFHERVALFVDLMFAFGHGCFNDNLYPWIAETLSDPTIADPYITIQNLHSKMISYFNDTLSLMNKR